MISIRYFAILMISVIILSGKNSTAQNTTFKLSDYKNPDYHYQALDLKFDLNNFLSTNKTIGNIDDYRNSSGLTSNAGANYSSNANSPGYQRATNVSFGAGFGSSDYLDNLTISNIFKQERKTSSFNHYEDLSVGALNRFYNAKQNYFEINGSFSTAYDGNSETNRLNNNDTITSFTSSKKYSSNNHASVALLIGIGRIEQVQDAQLAIYILEDLRRLNRDKRAVSDDDVMALAHQITSLKYKRFFDNRLRNIAAITAIDSFMQIKGIAGAADAAYYTSLNDNWNYAHNPVRNSGRRIFTGIEADYIYNQTNDKQENKRTNIDISEITDQMQGGSIFLVAGISSEKPVSLKWQRSANLKAGFGSGYQHTTNKYLLPETTAYKTNSFSGIFPSMKLSGDYGFGYYPNSRTWITASWLLSAYYGKEMLGTSRNDKENYQNSLNAYTGPLIYANYYLSEKFRMTCSFGGVFNLLHSKNTSNNALPAPDNKSTTTFWSQSLSAALTYSLF